MAWTTPITWATNQLVAAADLNAQVRDNFNYLFNGQPLSGSNALFSQWSTTSTTFVAVDATNLSKTLTVITGRVALFTRTLFGVGNVVGAYGTFDIQHTKPDASTVYLGHATYGLAQVPRAWSQHYSSLLILTGLASGSHTFKWHFKTSNSGAGANMGETAGGTDGLNYVGTVFNVWEF